MGDSSRDAGRVADALQGLMRGPAAVVVAIGACWIAPLSAQTWRTVTSARQAHGETELTVNVAYGVGEFRLAPGPAGGLYRMEMRYDEERFAPIREYDAETGRLRLGVRGKDGGSRISLGDRRRSGPTPRLDLTLAPDIPMALAMELGAVRADVELGGMALRQVSYRTGASESIMRFTRPNPVSCAELSLVAGASEFEVVGIGNANCRRVRFQGGVGEVTLDFSGDWRGSVDAEVDVGIGSLNLRLPTSVGVAIQLNRFLTSFAGAGFTKRGGTYYSANWDDARHRLTLDVNATIGGIDVAWVR